MRVDHLESTLNQIAQNDARFRSIAGLESIDSEVLQAGVGGPGLVGPEAHSLWTCLLYTSPSPRDGLLSRMPSSA